MLQYYAIAIATAIFNCLALIIASDKPIVQWDYFNPSFVINWITELTVAEPQLIARRLTHVY